MIRTGIGGWVYPDWRKGTFYPEGLAQKRELEWASRQLGAIEINGTYHSLQKPESFRKWREATPEGFKFAVKGSSYVTNRKVLASAGESLAKFFAQGIEELGDRLGPILWQLMGTKKFDAEDIAAFFALLPKEHAGLPLRHAIEIGHESFASTQFVDLCRAAGVAIVWCEQEGRTLIADRTADFAYIRCKNAQDTEPAGYPAAELDRIAALCHAWDQGEAPAGLPYAGDPAASQARAGDVFCFMIKDSGVTPLSSRGAKMCCFLRPKGVRAIRPCVVGRMRKPKPTLGLYFTERSSWPEEPRTCGRGRSCCEFRSVDPLAPSLRQALPDSATALRWTEQR